MYDGMKRKMAAANELIVDVMLLPRMPTWYPDSHLTTPRLHNVISVALVRLLLHGGDSSDARERCSQRLHRIHVQTYTFALSDNPHAHAYIEVVHGLIQLMYCTLNPIGAISALANAHRTQERNALVLLAVISLPLNACKTI